MHLVSNLQEAIRDIEGATESTHLTKKVGSTAMTEMVDAAAKTQPDAFIGLGDSAASFQDMLRYFKDTNRDHKNATTGEPIAGYSPKAAFYMGGLAATYDLARHSYNHGNEEPHWSFDQWMGFVPWTADMPHPGPVKHGWPLWLGEAQNPYGMTPDAMQKDRAAIEKQLTADIEAVNATLEPHEKIAKCLIVKDAWTIDNNMMTPTMKVKRNQVEARYGKLLASTAEDRSSKVAWED